MKKTVFSLLALLASLSANAADWGVTAGAGVASIANEDCESTVAYNVGAKVNFDLNENLILEASALFQHQGFSYRWHENILGLSFTSNKTFDFDLYYLNLPVNLGWNFKISDNFSIAPKLGLTLGFGLSGDESDYDCDPFSEREEISRVEVFGYTSGSALKNFNRLDVGFNMGANFNIAKQFQVGAQYTFGMSEVSDDFDDSSNRIFTANFTYFF